MANSRDSVGDTVWVHSRTKGSKGDGGVGTKNDNRELSEMEVTPVILTKLVSIRMDKGSVIFIEGSCQSRRHENVDTLNKGLTLC